MMPVMKSKSQLNYGKMTVLNLFFQTFLCKLTIYNHVSQKFQLRCYVVLSSDVTKLLGARAAFFAKGRRKNF